MSDTIRVVFDQPRSGKGIKSSWLLTLDGEDDLWLPKNSTTLETDETTGAVVAVTVPRFIAEDRGLVNAGIVDESRSDTMSRYDWLLLGTTMAMLIRGVELRDAVWEAKKVVAKLNECL